MNANWLINMILRRLVGRAVNAGINAGFRALRQKKRSHPDLDDIERARLRASRRARRAKRDS